MSEIIFARSLAGHDKDEIYLVLAREGDDCILVNGKNRTLDHPKKKRIKHIQEIKRLPKEVLDAFEGRKQTDEVIKRALKIYSKCIG